MARYRKKPIVIEAMQYDGTEATAGRIARWANMPDEDPWFDYTTFSDGVYNPVCHTLEGPLRVSKGDWIIKGVQGEFYPCKPGIFEATYEAVTD